MFKVLKSSGFNLEDTPLKDGLRIEKIVSLAFIWCYNVGIYMDSDMKPITIKTHGYRAKSLFKYGLEFIANILFNPQHEPNVHINDFLSCS